MSEGPKIRPALTGEEWASGRACHVVVVDTHQGKRRLTVGHDEGTTNPEEFHAIAALALHGQSFGFTRADVELLRETVNSDYDGMDINYWAGAGTEARLLSLAARIEALLPPEGA